MAKKAIKKSIKKIRARLWDFVFSPITLVSSLWFKRVRHFERQDMPITNKIFDWIGIYPLKDHYYEPLINRKSLDREFRFKRELPGIDWNEDGQVELLKQFDFKKELDQIPVKRTNKQEYYYEIGNFGPGDAGYLYSIIRYFKPKKIIEIGCGASTLMTINAVKKNKIENPDNNCEIICIEPYRQKWLSGLPIATIRDPVERLDLSFFQQLENNDILFIDSSHMIRPQGDVLHEYLHVLPALNSGVLIHAHDIFSPMDYPNEAIIDGKLFWNEQYLLEAFLCYNSEFQIIGALNYLANNHRDLLLEKLPKFGHFGSFWLAKN